MKSICFGQSADPQQKTHFGLRLAGGLFSKERVFSTPVDTMPFSALSPNGYEDAYYEFRSELFAGWTTEKGIYRRVNIGYGLIWTSSNPEWILPDGKSANGAIRSSKHLFSLGFTLGKLYSVKKFQFLMGGEFGGWLGLENIESQDYFFYDQSRNLEGAISITENDPISFNAHAKIQLGAYYQIHPSFSLGLEFGYGPTFAYSGSLVTSNNLTKNGAGVITNEIKETHFQESLNFGLPVRVEFPFLVLRINL